MYGGSAQGCFTHSTLYLAFRVCASNWSNVISMTSPVPVRAMWSIPFFASEMRCTVLFPFMSILTSSFARLRVTYRVPTQSHSKAVIFESPCPLSLSCISCTCGSGLCSSLKVLMCPPSATHSVLFAKLTHIAWISLNRPFSVKVVHLSLVVYAT